MFSKLLRACFVRCVRHAAMSVRPSVHRDRIASSASTLAPARSSAACAAGTTAAPRALRAMADSLKAVVLRGAGLEAHVSPLGATLVKLLAPDRDGALAGALRGQRRQLPAAVARTRS
jgi:hypothetical protein